MKKKKKVHYSVSEGYNHLKKYFQKYGYSNFHRDFKTKDGFPLGLYVRDKRKDYQKGILDKANIRLLGKLNFVWDVSIRHRWLMKFNDLKKYHQKYKSFVGITRYITESGYDLGVWFQNQKKYYAKGTLPQYRIEKLNELDINWHEKVILKRNKKGQFKGLFS